MVSLLPKCRPHTIMPLNLNVDTKLLQQPNLSVTHDSFRLSASLQLCFYALLPDSYCAGVEGFFTFSVEYTRLLQP